MTAVTRILAILLLALSFAAPATAATAWQIIHEDSRLGFTGTQQGGEFTGRFKRFQAEMRFSPDDLANSHFDVTIDITSVTTGSSQRDRYLPDEEWFNTDAFPKAHYETTGFRHLQGNRYEAEGKLTLKGNTRPVTLTFTWTIDGDTATMDGQATLTRTRFDVGTGQWTEGDTVGKQVTVNVDLKLRKE